MTAVRLQTDERGIARLTVARPDRKNAFDQALITELTAAVARIDRSARAVVLQSEGDIFSAGADVEWMRAAVDLDYEANVRDANALRGMLEAIDRWLGDEVVTPMMYPVVEARVAELLETFKPGTISSRFALFYASKQ